MPSKSALRHLPQGNPLVRVQPGVVYSLRQFLYCSQATESPADDDHPRRGVGVDTRQRLVSTEPAESQPGRTYGERRSHEFALHRSLLMSVNLLLSPLPDARSGRPTDHLREEVPFAAPTTERMVRWERFAELPRQDGFSSWLLPVP